MLFLFKFCVLLTEAVYATGCVEKALLAGKERMACGAHFNVDCLALGGEDLLLMTASTNDCRIEYFWVNVFFHQTFGVHTSHAVQGENAASSFGFCFRQRRRLCSILSTRQAIIKESHKKCKRLFYLRSASHSQRHGAPCEA